MKKDKWFGKCGLCGIETKLSTSKTSIERTLGYTIIRCCDSCHKIMRRLIDTGLIVCAEKRKEQK